MNVPLFTRTTLNDTSLLGIVILSWLLTKGRGCGAEPLPLSLDGDEPKSIEYSLSLHETRMAATSAATIKLHVNILCLIVQ